MANYILLYSAALLAISVVLYVGKSVLPSVLQRALPALMPQFFNLSFAVCGAYYVTAGTNPIVGWLMIITATVGTIIHVLKSNEGGGTFGRKAPSL